MSLSKLQEIVKDREAWHAAISRIAESEHNLVTEQWTTDDDGTKKWRGQIWGGLGDDVVVLGAWLTGRKERWWWLKSGVVSRIKHLPRAQKGTEKANTGYFNSEAILMF